MTSDFKKLGIIAGGGTIPKMLIAHCQKIGRPFFVLAIEGNADKTLVDGSVPHLWIRIGQAGTGFKKLHDEKVEEVIMIGTIRRPSFFDLLPDMRTTAFFAKIGTKALGDDGILRALVHEIEAEGMAVRGVHEVMSDLLVKKGCLSRTNKPKPIFAAALKLRWLWDGLTSGRRWLFNRDWCWPSKESRERTSCCAAAADINARVTAAFWLSSENRSRICVLICRQSVCRRLNVPKRADCAESPFMPETV